MPVTDYGSDLSTFTSPDGSADLDPNFARIAGARVVIERLARKLQTTTGSMFKAGWGFDVRDLLQAALTPAGVAAVQGEVQRQCEDEEEVASADATVNLVNGVLTITVRVVLNVDVVFDLVFTITEEKVTTIINAILQES